MTDAQWAVLEPLIDEVQPHCNVPHEELRQTIETIFWRHQNGAKWRNIPAEWAVVEGGADLHPLGEARRLGAAT